MEFQQPSDSPQWGFISPDGFFQAMSSLTSHNLEFVSKSLGELLTELQENIELEKYERCALIRDEINKRRPA